MKNTILFIFIAALMLGTIAGCKKTNYLTDGGLSNPKSPLTTYEYLKQHQYQLFDTLIMVIDHYQMKDEVNTAATFFAPTNYSINKYISLKQAEAQKVDENAKYTLANMYQDLTADSIRMYCIKSRVELMTTSETAKIVENNAKNTPTAVQRMLQPKINEAWSSAPIYYLFFTKVINGLDPPGSNAPADDPDRDISIRCQTTGIEPASGGILNVLSNQHTFVRF